MMRYNQISFFFTKVHRISPTDNYESSSWLNSENITALADPSA
jgi:hypothetical protein